MRNDTSSSKTEGRWVKSTMVLMEKERSLENHALVLQGNCSKDLGNDGCVPGSILCTLHMLSHLILTVHLQGGGGGRVSVVVIYNEGN